MSKFYRREETEKEVKIIFTSLAVRMYLSWGLLIAMFLLLQSAKENLLVTLVIFPLILITLILVSTIFIIAYWKPMKEVRAGLKKGEVKVSGSRMSLKNPRTIVIPKQ